MSEEAATYFFYTAPKPAGSWQIAPQVYITSTKRPRWLTRVLCKWLLEWEWVDAKPEGER